MFLDEDIKTLPKKQKTYPSFFYLVLFTRDLTLTKRLYAVILIIFQWPNPPSSCQAIFPLSLSRPCN